MPRKLQSRPWSERRVKVMSSVLGVDVVGWMENARIDRIAAYASRGRHYARLSMAALVDTWKAAQRAHASDPWSDQARQDASDLDAEFELRGVVPPIEEVTDSLELFGRKVKEQADRLKSDPEAWQLGKERIVEDIITFKKSRDSSRN